MNSKSAEVLAGGWGGVRGLKKNFDQLEKKTVNSLKIYYYLIFSTFLVSVYQRLNLPTSLHNVMAHTICKDFTTPLSGSNFIGHLRNVGFTVCV